MGLDMYLTKKTYVGANYDFNNVNGEININKEGIKLPINFKRVVYIDEQVGYWRKANQIHKWFVDNVQNGEDDCKSYYVEIDQLKELLEICRIVENSIELEEKEIINDDGIKLIEKIIKNDTTAKQLLPCKSGFFFGSTMYDEWYLEDIKNTIEILKNVIQEEEQANKKHIFTEYEYRASW